MCLSRHKNWLQWGAQSWQYWFTCTYVCIYIAPHASSCVLIMVAAISRKIELFFIYLFLRACTSLVGSFCGMLYHLRHCRTFFSWHVHICSIALHIWHNHNYIEGKNIVTFFLVKENTPPAAPQTLVIFIMIWLTQTACISVNDKDQKVFSSLYM